MKTPNSYHQVAVLKNREPSTIFNPELARKFEEASKKKQGVEDFVNEFMKDFLAEDTKRAYMKDLDLFFSFLRSGGQKIIHPKEIQAYHFQLYRDTLISKGLAPATINRRLVAIRSFVKWSIAAKLMDHNPLDSVKLPKVQTTMPTVAFDDEEVVRMINAPDLSDHKGRRDRLAMVLLFNLGLRRNELVTIKLKDIYEERGHNVLKIHGKGDKVRVVPLNPFVLAEIQRYLDVLACARIFLEAEDYLLQTSDKKRQKNVIPVDGSTIYRTINGYAKALQINKREIPEVIAMLETYLTP